MKNSIARVGVDIGGTFPDVVLAHAGGMPNCKVQTNYSQPEQAILDGIGIGAEQAGIKLSTIGQVIYCTILVTNALIAVVPNWRLSPLRVFEMSSKSGLKPSLNNMI
jgi:N-methylhydantoinase A